MKLAGVIILIVFSAMVVAGHLLPVYAELNGRLEVDDRITIVAVTGKAQILRGFPSRWSDLRIGDVLRIHDRIRTGQDGRVELNVADRARIQIGADTDVVMLVEDGDLLWKSGRSAPVDTPVLRVNVGKIWTHVLKRLTRFINFAIETPTAIAGVRGTIFTVEVDHAGDTRVAVTDGLVEVRNASGSVMVPAGEEVDVKKQAKPGLLKRVKDRDKDADSWQKKQAVWEKKAEEQISRKAQQAKDRVARKLEKVKAARKEKKPHPGLEKRMDRLEAALQGLEELENEIGGHPRKKKE